MNVLIAVPGISYASFIKSRFVNGDSEIVDVSEFTPTDRTLDVFPKEMKGISPPGFWGIGIPHWPMVENLTNGVAGPGLPKEELFVPESIEEDMQELAGQYDKWRPYPAIEPLSQYACKMARKMTTKRGKFFEHVLNFTLWETIFWVEHSAASIGHLDQDAAMEISDRIFGKSIKAVRKRPAATFVYFSPYGVGNDPGFVVSNRLDPKLLSNWDGIRQYLNGRLD